MDQQPCFPIKKRTSRRIRTLQPQQGLNLCSLECNEGRNQRGRYGNMRWWRRGVACAEGNTCCRRL